MLNYFSSGTANSCLCISLGQSTQAEGLSHWGPSNTNKRNTWGLIKALISVYWERKRAAGSNSWYQVDLWWVKVLSARHHFDSCKLQQPCKVRITIPICRESSESLINLLRVMKMANGLKYHQRSQICVIPKPTQCPFQNVNLLLSFHRGWQIRGHLPALIHKQISVCSQWKERLVKSHLSQFTTHPLR